MYRLFRFDRELRFLIFRLTTLAEAELKTICAYEFSKHFPNEKNAYLNVENYSDTAVKRAAAKKLLEVIEKIIKNACHGEKRKEYIDHAYEQFDGELPLWVLTNDMTIGQIYWFYSVQKSEIKTHISNHFTMLYQNTYKKSSKTVRITSEQLSKRYRRITFFRNICAHDERLYCAHLTSNENFKQLLSDLKFFVTKQQYVESLMQLQKLMSRLDEQLPKYSLLVFHEMGFESLVEVQNLLNRVRAVNV